MKRPLPPTQREAIRDLFLHRQRVYTTAQAATVLRLTVTDIEEMIEDGKIQAEYRKKNRQLGGRRQLMIRWTDLVRATMRHWTAVQVHDALGDRAKDWLPRLLWPEELNVRLPLYQVRLLEALAQDSGVTLESYLHRYLGNLATSPAQAERLVPDFNKAVAFPEQ